MEVATSVSRKVSRTIDFFGWDLPHVLKKIGIDELCMQHCNGLVN